MKNLFIFLLIITCFSACAQDSSANQSNQTPQDSKAYTQKQGKGNKHDKYQQLGLNSDQQQKLNQIKADEKSKHDAIMNDKSLSADQQQAQLKALKKETNKQANSILTPDQKTKLKTIKSQKKSQSSQNTDPST